MGDELKKSLRRLFSFASDTAPHEFQSSFESSLRYELRYNYLIEHILHDDTLGITAEHYANQDIVVSLTSYGRRIHEVALTIESLMQQTMKANRIVLWLSEDLENHPLPQALVTQQRRGLEVKFCRDIRSFTKLIPQLKDSPEDVIITVDDDTLYDYDVLEHLITAYIQQPNMIHCCRVHRMLFDNRGALLPYNSWEWNCSVEGADRMYFLTGIGGVLYPPHSLDNEVFNESVFLDICPEADDVWFTAMALKKGTPINKVFTRNDKGEDYIQNNHPLERGLLKKNVKLFGNDRQLCDVFDRYSIYALLSGNGNKGIHPNNQ